MTYYLPYPEGPMTDPAGFIGREREVVRLAGLLNEGRSVALVGPRGIGKSSLLIHLLHAAPMLLDDPPPTVLVDLAQVQTPEDLYRPMLLARDKTGASELDVGIALEERSLLMGLDNLERAGPGFTRAVRSNLRGLLREGRLQLLVASDRPLAEIAPDMTADLSEESLGVMPEREARALVAEMLRRAEVEAPPGEVGAIVANAGGHPARLRRAVELWLRSNSGAEFDWQRTFREEFPSSAGLADAVAIGDVRLESEASGSGSRLGQRLRERYRREAAEQRTYESEDISALFLCVAVVAALVLAAYLPSHWPMRLASFLLVFGILVVAIPWAGLRSGWQASPSFQSYLEGLRMIPGVRALLRRFE